MQTGALKMKVINELRLDPSQLVWRSDNFGTSFVDHVEEFERGELLATTFRRFRKEL